MGKTVKIITSVILVIVFVSAFFACAASQSIAKKHPAEVQTMPICSDCHDDGRASLNHTADYIARHKFYAAQQKRTCDICHVESFCADCHANKEELKPSDKLRNAPWRTAPHPGDYLSQHKIDGKINPASCFPCHGRQNNERCRVCHK